jgi:hypothetical protein
MWQDYYRVAGEWYDVDRIIAQHAVEDLAKFLPTSSTMGRLPECQCVMLRARGYFPHGEDTS